MRRSIYVTGLFALAAVLLNSCTEQHAVSLDKWESLKPGANVYFEEQPPAVVGVNSIADLTYTATVLDPTGRVASYELQVHADLSATANVRTHTGTLGTYTTFPLEIEYGATDLAQAVGMTVDSISFGDSFYFSGIVTDDEGNEYYAGDPSLEVEIEGNDTVYVFDGGGSINEIYYDPTTGYRNAFQFQFTIGCPENTMNIDDLVGTWAITVDDFDTYLHDGTFEMIKGPGENQVTCVDWFGHPEAYDVVLTLDPATNAITVDRQPAWHCDNWGCGYGEGSVDGGGTMFQCAGFMSLTLEHTVAAGSFGSYLLVCEKQ